MKWRRKMRRRRSMRRRMMRRRMKFGESVKAAN
jgi:hypothetical protein